MNKRRNYFGSSRRRSLSINYRLLIPICLIVILSIIAICLYVGNKNRAGITYTKLLVTYNGETQTYDDLSKMFKITINDNDIILSSIEQKRLILTSIKKVVIDNQEVNEFIIYGGNKYHVCTVTNDCYELEYSR